MRCQFAIKQQEDGRYWATCVACGRSVVTRTRNVVAQCREVQPGLGDMVAAGLAGVGITKARVEAVIGWPCGCEERQEWLNRIGHEWFGLPAGHNTETR